MFDELFTQQQQPIGMDNLRRAQQDQNDQQLSALSQLGAWLKPEEPIKTISKNDYMTEKSKYSKFKKCNNPIEYSKE